MSPAVRPIREGYHTAIPGIVVHDATKAVEFYQHAFGAVEKDRMMGPDGKSIIHTELKIGDSTIFLSDEGMGMSVRSPQSLKGTSSSIHLNVEDADAAFHKAVKAGAKPVMPPTDMFWGDRYAQVVDPYGHVWGLGTHKEDVSPAEIKTRADAFYKQMASQPRPGSG